MNRVQCSLALGIGFTAVMLAAEVGLFGLSDRLKVPVVAKALEALGIALRTNQVTEVKD
jgi:hypothetical protein